MIVSCLLSQVNLWKYEADSYQPDAGKDWGQEEKEKGMTEDKMVGWHHWLSGHEFKQAPGDGEGQGSLEYCSPWGHKEWDTTEWLNNEQQQYIALLLIRNRSKFRICCKLFYTMAPNCVHILFVNNN